MYLFFLNTKLRPYITYLRHILLQNVVTNIDKFKKTVKFCESHDYEVRPSLCSHGLKVKNAIL
jgi:hypothetical protein